MKGRKRFFSLVLAALIAIYLPATTAWGEIGDVPAPSAILMDAGTGTVLYEKNIHEQRASGSVTKLMSILLFMEAIDSEAVHLEDNVTVSAFANSMGGSEIWLEVGEVMTVNELLKAIIIQSANDATVALAEHIAGSEEAFLNRMNERAAQLGMKNTHYLNTTGFDEEGQYTTAYDIALVARELLKHERVFDYTMIWMDELRDGKTQLTNTNKLLKTYAGITGLKTGTTDDAGNCFCGTAERNGFRLIAVVLGCETSKERFSATTALLDHGYANWETVVPELSDELLTPVPVLNGMTDRVMGTIQQDQTSLLVRHGRADHVEYRIALSENLEAPVETGQRIGSVEMLLEGEILHTFPVVSTSSVNKITFARAFLTLFRALLCSKI